MAASACSDCANSYRKHSNSHQENEMSKSLRLSEKWFRRGLFATIAVVGASPVPPAKSTPEHLQQIVGRLRGDWK